MPRDERTLLVPNGTELGTATSALTKALRRGDEARGMYWALQVEERFPKYLWRRLAVFAAEDVGMADPDAISVVTSLTASYERARTQSRAPRPDPALVGFGVLYLARAPKNREADDLAQAVMHAIADGWMPAVPPEAMDLHTAEGRARIPRDERLAHWLNEASHVENPRGTQDWRLWIRRWAARRGRLDTAEVEVQAEDWLDEGRLRWGVEGYRFEREES